MQVGMPIRQTVDVIISARNDADHRAHGEAGLQDVGVAGQKARVRQGETAQPILFVRVHARQIEDQVRLNALKQLREVVVQPRQINVVTGAIGQVNVQVTGSAPSGIVLLTMHREGEDAGFGLEDEGCSIALVDIQIDNESPANLAGIEQGARGYADVVEYAVARATVRSGMVTTAGRVAREAVLQGQTGRQEGAADRRPDALHHRRGHRHADQAFDARRDGRSQDLPDVIRIVNGGEEVKTGGIGNVKSLRTDKTFVLQTFGQPDVFLHREPVARGQGGAVGRVVDDRWKRGRRGHGSVLGLIAKRINRAERRSLTGGFAKGLPRPLRLVTARVGRSGLSAVRGHLVAAGCKDVSTPHVCSMAKLLVWYDGDCPLCRREIALMRRLDRRGAIQFVDVAKGTDDTCPVDRATLLARFHAREHGRVLSGAAAFAAMWRAIPLLRPIGLAARNRWILAVLEAGYRGFLRLRPSLQWTVRRLRSA